MKARQLKDIIYHAFIDTQQGLLSSCNVTRESTIYGGSRHYIQEVYGSMTGDLTYNALPGFIIPFVFYLATSYTSTAAASERSTGVYCRSLVSGLTKLEIILAHIVVQVMISSVQNCLLMGCLYIIFGSPMEGSFLTALVFIVLTELQGALFGIFLASLIKSETRLTNVVIGTAMSLFLTSGMIRPVEAMRPILLRVMQYSPIIVAVEAYRSVSRRGWGLDSPKVMSAFTFNAAAVAILVVANIVTAKLNIVK